MATTSGQPNAFRFDVKSHRAEEPSAANLRLSVSPFFCRCLLGVSVIWDPPRSPTSGRDNDKPREHTDE